MIILIILLGIIAAFLVFVLLTSLKMSNSLSKPEYKTYQFTIDRSKNEEHSWGDLDTYEKEPFDVTLKEVENGFEMLFMDGDAVDMYSVDRDTILGHMDEIAQRLV